MFIGAFDESGQLSDTAHVVFGGWAASPANWESISEQWEDRLKGKPSHLKMAEAMRLQGPFKGWGEVKRDALLLDLGRIVESLAVGASGMVDCKAFKALRREHQKALKDKPVYCAFEACVKSLMKFKPEVPFALYCDDSTAYAERVLSLYHRMKEKTPEFKGRCTHIAFADDEKFIPIQAAEMLSYSLRARISGGGCKPVIAGLMDIFSEGGTKNLRLGYSVGKGLGDGEIEALD